MLILYAQTITRQAKSRQSAHRECNEAKAVSFTQRTQRSHLPGLRIRGSVRQIGPGTAGETAGRQDEFCTGHTPHHHDHPEGAGECGFLRRLSGLEAGQAHGRLRRRHAASPALWRRHRLTRLASDISRLGRWRPGPCRVRPDAGNFRGDRSRCDRLLADAGAEIRHPRGRPD
ncbi:hypothetical protein D3C72_1129870 [compost metagenome]